MKKFIYILIAVALLIGAGAFYKSVMESTSYTSREYHSRIAGIENVWDSFKRSLATGDWSNWYNGIYDVYERGKIAEEARIDAEYSAIAYDFLVQQYKDELDRLQREYNSY